MPIFVLVHVAWQTGVAAAWVGTGEPGSEISRAPRPQFLVRAENRLCRPHGSDPRVENIATPILGRSWRTISSGPKSTLERALKHLRSSQ